MSNLEKLGFIWDGDLGIICSALFVDFKTTIDFIVVLVVVVVVFVVGVYSCSIIVVDFVSILDTLSVAF